MRIGFDATYSVGKNLSGVGVYSRELMWGLAKAHADQKFGFYYRPHRMLRSFQDSLPPNASRRLLRGLPSVDLFHALNQRVDARARRTVTTYHDLFVMTGDYSSPDFRVRFAAQARQAAAASDAIIAVSRFTANHVRDLLGVDEARIHVVPHGVQMPSALPQRREPMILFAGVIQRRKNFARVVKAFETMPPEWRLVVAGAKEGYGAQQELSAVEQSPRRAAIQLVGHVTRDQLNGLFSRASVFAFPSLDEGFGMPILEAMAHGVPVVTSNISAMPEVAGDAALLVDPTSVEQIAEAFQTLIANRALRDELVSRGLARAREFTWEKAAEQTWAVYQDLL